MNETKQRCECGDELQPCGNHVEVDLFNPCEECKTVVAERLAYLRGEIEAEQISMTEIIELQGLADYIDPYDVLLLEWAGVPENEEA